MTTPRLATRISTTPIATDKNFYDTFVSTPQFDATPTAAVQGTNLNVTGSADWPVGPGSTTPVVPTSSTNTNAGNQAMNIVLGDQAGNQAATNTTGGASSTYTIAQFTVVGNTGGYLKGYVGGTSASNTAQFFTNHNGTGPNATLPNGVIYMPILGDDDKDGAVGGSDFTTVQNNFGNGAGPGSGGDVEHDNIVGGSDFTIVQNNFGNTLSYTPPPGGALGSLVPEPTSLAVIGLGLGLLAGRRRQD